jgi:hypothetical protein
MKDTKLANLKARVKLLEDIKQADHMLMYSVQTQARILFDEVIKPIMYVKNGQTTSELPVDDVVKLRVFLANLFENNLGNIDSLCHKYTTEKITKEEILAILSE